MTAVRRVYLVRHAGTAVTSRGGFALDEPLSVAGAAAAAALADVLPSAVDVLCSPTARTRQTAAAAGRDAAEDPRLAPLDVGCWAGLQLSQIDPAGLADWLADPDARPHGGETVSELVARIRLLLADWQLPRTGSVLAVTHAAVIRAAVVVALDAPDSAFWRVDVAPASVTELHTRGRGWALFRSNAGA